MSMRGGGMGGGGRMGLRSLSRDRKILEHQIKKGTLPRILKFARRYRSALIFFLSVVVLDAIISSVSPLLLRAIIDIGIPKHRAGLVIELAAITASLAIADAGLQMFERRVSAVIGEGLIYDLRVEVDGMACHQVDRAAEPAFAPVVGTEGPVLGLPA